MKYTLDTLEQRVRYTRKKILAMTQDEFAEALGVTRDVISRYETGKTKLPSKQALKIIELANISADWLLSGRGEMPIKSKEGLTASEVVASRINTLEEDLKQLRDILKDEAQDLGIEVPDVEKTTVTKTGDIINSLTELEIQYKNLMENPPIGEFIYQDDKLKYFDENFLKLLGYAKESMANVSIWELVHPEDREMAKEKALKRIGGEKLPPSKLRVYKGNGEVVTVWGTGTRIEYEGRPAMAGKYIIVDEWDKLGQSIEKLKTLLYKEFIKT